MNEKKAKALRKALRCLPSKPLEAARFGPSRYPEHSRERMYHDMKRAAR